MCAARLNYYYQRIRVVVWLEYNVNMRFAYKMRISVINRVPLSSPKRGASVGAWPSSL